jgi:hypothetical protein
VVVMQARDSSLVDCTKVASADDILDLRMDMVALAELRRMGDVVVQMEVEGIQC